MSQNQFVVVFVSTVSPMAKEGSDDSCRPLPLSPLLLPASSTKTSSTPHTVNVVRRPGESLGISIVGGLLHSCLFYIFHVDVVVLILNPILPLFYITCLRHWHCKQCFMQTIPEDVLT